ncbi:transglutaminase-like domain-containing protein [Desmospora profundinema]|uniref:Transglutaminase-like putative cysteine protease n=1 Tax=Desmospora profundinema TaxID=1571184 RepID=A0ABU1IIA3_9BACL|nr:transglutaminase family protein [Desmospora profundinema]MDR6224421.1 transglutaminase-like putative cysteine protease [Desmospora profundinema]
MNLSCQSSVWEDYLSESDEVDVFHPLVQQRARGIRRLYSTATDRIKYTFEFVRDQIHHSWDIQSSRVTRKASDVLRFGEGICYAKSHLLVALLRAQEIPAGFCYQRLTRGDTPDTGYVIHALNAVYLDSLEKWVRIDARGNKPGVNAEFSPHVEQLAFPIRPEMGEVEYPMIYVNPQTSEVLKEHTHALELCRYHLPSEL